MSASKSYPAKLDPTRIDAGLDAPAGEQRRRKDDYPVGSPQNPGGAAPSYPTATPRRRKQDFFLSITLPGRRADDTSAESPGGLLLWSSIDGPDADTIAVATIGLDAKHGHEIALCSLPSQVSLAEIVIGALARTVTQRKAILNADDPTLIIHRHPSGILSPGRGYILVKPTCFPAGSFAPPQTMPVWALPLWLSEVDTMREMGREAFLETLTHSGLNLFDLERPSITGERIAPVEPVVEEIFAAGHCEHMDPSEAGQDDEQACLICEARAAAQQGSAHPAVLGADGQHVTPHLPSLFHELPHPAFGAALHTRGLTALCPAEIILGSLASQETSLRAIADILDGLLRAERPEIAHGFIVGPYGELPGAKEKVGLYFLSPPPELAALLPPDGRPTLWCVPVTMREIEKARGMDRRSFAADVLAIGSSIWDLDRACSISSMPAASPAPLSTYPEPTLGSPLPASCEA